MILTPKQAKIILEWYAGGATISGSLIDTAITTLVRGKPNPYVEDCIRRRARLEGVGLLPRSPSSPTTPKEAQR